MSIEIGLEEARNSLAFLAAAGWKSAACGLKIIDRLEGYSYRAASLGAADAASIYAVRAASFRGSGREGVEVERFLAALQEARGEPILIFSVADDKWSCVCAATVDLATAIAAVALPVVRSSV
ncbi:hypothetical protein [Streptacidiphilus melanogenes]|uniref:hypothetical protein n=1 Tax=Streptacidiphilus melanogenes TaxID=411235 RepID=UPI0012699D5D|nr:hypothetical protein [Streptacidiphilus melanogenes]